MTPDILKQIICMHAVTAWEKENRAYMCTKFDQIFGFKTSLLKKQSNKFKQHFIENLMQLTEL